MAPQMKITIYEAQNKLLAKVAITGGGRCNITNTFNNYKDAGGKITRLEEVYPRGCNLMKRLLMGLKIYIHTWMEFQLWMGDAPV